MQWPDVFLEGLAEERQRELIASASHPFDTPRRHTHPMAPRGWRRVLWLAGHALEGLGQRVEEIAAARAQP